MIAGKYSRGVCEVFDYETFKGILKHPEGGDIHGFGISSAPDHSIFTLGGTTELDKKSYNI